jgi:acyl-[acyl-carrier-protein]-phospholipid O-acyltransferase/long-chain-fatty-acid--[acyl-carrier-protein] ligase
VSLNLKSEQSTGLHEAGHREGTVGLPLPAVELKIISADTGEELSRGKKGLLLVKGPNVMLGYLNREEETAEVIRDGWYNTGDIASIDEDGFLTIEGRLSRFSKIGGEMVPHAGIEEVYSQALNTSEQVVAVTGVPDDKKGEEIVVLHVEEAGDADRLHEIIRQSELPNIWRPSRKNYIKIDSMPTLGSGKLDIMKLHKIALVAKNHTEGR